MAGTSSYPSSPGTEQRLGHDGQRGRAVTILVDGEPIASFEGETIGAALLASGRRVLRRTPAAAAPRGLFCGMGVCFDCVVGVDDRHRLRACITEVQEGMSVTTHEV